MDGSGGGAAAEHEEVPFGSRINLCLIQRNSCQWSVEHESDSTTTTTIGSRLVHTTSTLRCTFEFLINDPSWDCCGWCLWFSFRSEYCFSSCMAEVHRKWNGKILRDIFMLFFMASRLHLRITVEGFSPKQLHLAGSVTELPFYNVLQ